MLNLDPKGRLCSITLSAYAASLIGSPLIDPLLSIINTYSYRYGSTSSSSSLLSSSASPPTFYILSSIFLYILVWFVSMTPGFGFNFNINSCFIYIGLKFGKSETERALSVPSFEYSMKAEGWSILESRMYKTKSLPSRPQRSESERLISAWVSEVGLSLIEWFLEERR